MNTLIEFLAMLVGFLVGAVAALIMLGFWVWFLLEIWNG